jgi:hypothetical protein
MLRNEVMVLHAHDGRHFLKRDCTQEKSAFPEVVDMLFAPHAAPPLRRLYARAPLVSELRADVSLAGLAELVGGEQGAHGFRDASCGVWLGSAGCVTPLHYDLCHGFLIGVLGNKSVTYYGPEDYCSLYARTEQPELSTVNLDAWRFGEATVEGRAERIAHPRFGEATAWHAELRPGDVLYTPPYWWHHVETGAESALSVLVPFDPLPEEPVHACHFR